MFNTQGQPVDWTAGTGVLPSGGVIMVPANLYRHWLYVQAQGANQVTIGYAAVSGADGVTPTVANVILAGGGSAGSMGSSDERNIGGSFVPVGIVTITGTPGDKICVMEG